MSLPTPKSTLEKVLVAFYNKLNGKPYELPTAQTNSEKILSEIVKGNISSGGGGGGGDVPSDLIGRLEKLEKVFSINPDERITKIINFNTFRSDLGLGVHDPTPIYKWVTDEETFGTLTIKPTNKGVHNSSSTIEIAFNITRPLGTIGFKTRGSGEGSHDKLSWNVVRLDNNASVASGIAVNNDTVWSDVSILLPTNAFYKIILTYSKDSSDNRGLDCYWVSNMYISGGV